MRDMVGQFTKVFRTREGLKFNGELSLPIERTTPSDFRPRRLLTVNKKALVKTGDVIFGDDTAFLVTLSATFSQTYQFKCFEITHRLSWYRYVSREDYVTGLETGMHPKIIDDSLPVVVEYGAVLQDMKIETERYKIITGADLQIGDRVGAWVVQNKKEALGLNLVEVS